MKKYNLPFCFVLAILTLSCGTRKVSIEKTEQVKDSIVIQNHYSQASKTILMDIFTAKPIDALKPMWINGKQYQNAIITNDKSKIHSKSFDIYKTHNIYRTYDVYKTEQTDKTDNTILWVGIAFIVCLFVFLFLYLPKLKTGI